MDSDVDAIVAPDLERSGAPAAAVVKSAGPASHLIRVARPEPGETSPEESLREAMRSALEIAAREGFRSVAFPPLGADPDGLSLQRCAEIMLSEVREPFARDGLDEVRFVLSGEPSYRIFEQAQDAERIRIQLERLKRGRA